MGLTTGAIVFAASAAVTVLACQIYDKLKNGKDRE